jgi:hypothetical protein
MLSAPLPPPIAAQDEHSTCNIDHQLRGTLVTFKNVIFSLETEEDVPSY